MRDFTFGSLFAGIGGLDLGLERAGMHCTWQVETNDYCNRVLERHWPNVRRYGDVRECGRHNLEPVDLICGGFPCQDVSHAGKRKGLKEGTRTGLWYEFARIIRELRPRWVLAENVPGLLSTDSGRGMGAVLGDLAACGCDAEWDCIPAAAFGAPHLRYRVFIVAHTQFGLDRSEEQCDQTLGQNTRRSPSGFGRPSIGNGQETLAYTDRRRWCQGRERLRRKARPNSGWSGARSDVAYTEGERCREEGQHSKRSAQRLASGREVLADSLPERRPWRPSIFQTSRTTRGFLAEGSNAWGADKPDVGGAPDGVPAELDSPQRVAYPVADWEQGVPRVAKGVPHATDRLRALGNAVVPQVAEWIGRRILEADGNNSPKELA